jgi:hypothetical protein
MAASWPSNSEAAVTKRKGVASAAFWGIWLAGVLMAATSLLRERRRV